MKTEAAERNNVAKATILYARSTEGVKAGIPPPYSPVLCVLCGSISGLGPETGLDLGRAGNILDL